MDFIENDFINVVSIKDAISKVELQYKSGLGFMFFTLNSDHLCKLRKFPSFRDLYRRATFVSADGWPVAVLARGRRTNISRTTGADLVFPLCEMAARNSIKVYLFGSTEEVLRRSSKTLSKLYPDLQFAGACAPPRNFVPRSSYALDCANAIAESGASLCLVALGAPTQESFADVLRESCPKIGLVCVGAALDFIAGTQHRAPKIFQLAGMEWLWRLALSPKRLGRRYIECIFVILGILMLRLRLAGSKK